jgi:O-antigen/teichoic acid export membrane protein
VIGAGVRAVADALPLVAFRAASGGMPILLGLFIANRWGLEELAAYTVAAAMIAIAAIVADWGALRALPRDLALLAPDAARGFLASATGLRLLFVAALFVIGVAAARLGWLDPEVVSYLSVLFALCPLTIATTNALSERVVEMRTRAIGVAVVAGLVVFAILAVVAIAGQRGPLSFVAAYVAGKAAEAAILVSGRWWVIAARPAGAGSAAVSLWPFAAQMILGVVYSRLAVFTVERMATRAELGVFSVAIALQAALVLVPSSLALLYFPDLTRRAQAGDVRGMRHVLLRYTIVSMLGVTLGVAILIVLISPIAEQLKVPSTYGTFIVAFAALTYLTTFSTMSGFLLQARGDESLAARLSLLTLLLALVYQVAALALAGLPGILFAAAAGEVTAIVVFGQALRRSGLVAAGVRA